MSTKVKTEQDLFRDPPVLWAEYRSGWEEPDPAEAAVHFAACVPWEGHTHEYDFANAAAHLAVIFTKLQIASRPAS